MNQQRAAAANLQQAQARLQDARATSQELAAGVRPETIAQAEAELARNKAQVALIDAQLNDTRLVAPRAGLVAERQARVGATTVTSEPLFELIQDGRLEVQLTLPETDLEQIRVGQPVRLTSDANPELAATGRIREIAPLVDAESRQATVKVDVPRQGLKPGMFVRAEIVVTTTAGVTVPAPAVLPQSDGSAIAFVLQPDETVVATPVEMGELLADNRVEIRSGLEAGAQVVVKGAPYLNDGDRVRIASDLLDAPAAPASDG
ncbi:MAG: efflux RND transporter periplasmic adaptor subunit [Spirulinaceae cyanobacterium SM2_1_0]|nr:efflux RND transporter periplasmic adaptor subunit [Spirulinaceae cyanobacterium SM2_1_0]